MCHRDFRVSVAASLADLGLEELLQETAKSADVLPRLAAAYAANGLNDQASRYFTKALRQAEGYEAKKPIIELAAAVRRSSLCPDQTTA